MLMTGGYVLCGSTSWPPMPVTPVPDRETNPFPTMVERRLSVAPREMLMNNPPAISTPYQDMAAAPLNPMPRGELYYPIKTDHGGSIQSLHTRLCDAIPDSRRLIQIMFKSFL